MVGCDWMILMAWNIPTVTQELLLHCWISFFPSDDNAPVAKPAAPPSFPYPSQSRKPLRTRSFLSSLRLFQTFFFSFSLCVILLENYRQNGHLPHSCRAQEARSQVKRSGARKPRRFCVKCVKLAPLPYPAICSPFRLDCTAGLYVAPKMGDIVDSLQPLPISWDPTCLSNQEIDIYLLSPNSDYPRIHLWEGVARTRGTYDAEIMPRWWNATSTQSLQISIVPSGQPLFMSTFPAGPVFNATYTQPSSGMPESADTSKIDSGITAVNDSANAKKAMNPGKKAAAVLLPLLFLLLCAGAYIKLKRSKGLGKRKAWTEAVDKRMSTISTDWKSVSGAGANAAIRNSMAVGNRNSSFSFGALRPSSTFAVEGDESSKQMSQVRTGTGVGLRNPAALSSTERISRVSFAPDTRQSRASIADSRPSGESRRTRAFHSAYIPPVPALPDSATDDAEDTSASFSPRQTQGAMTLTPEDIRSRITAGKTKNGSQDKSEFAEFMPALSSKSVVSVVLVFFYLHIIINSDAHRLWRPLRT